MKEVTNLAKGGNGEWEEHDASLIDVLSDDEGVVVS